MKFFHIHIYSKPIVSQYISFSTREIIFECRCGCRVAKMISKPFGVSFPINTNSLNSKEFNEVLNGIESKHTKITIEIDKQVWANLDAKL